MPYSYVAPEVFMQHNGVKIYHGYVGKDINRRATYHYTTSRTEAEEYEFSVEKLVNVSTLDQSSWAAAENSIKSVIRWALDNGLIKLDQEA